WPFVRGRLERGCLERGRLERGRLERGHLERGQLNTAFRWSAAVRVWAPECGSLAVRYEAPVALASFMSLQSN
ncbi:hypothetical protein BX616_009458, partial [Lobosporangium transversale]